MNINEAEPTYNCDELLQQCEADLEYASSKDFQMLQHRIEVLTHLVNCGIQYTTLAQLNQIH